MKKLKLNILVIAALCSFSVLAQEQCITPYFGENVICLEEDADFVWLGTRGKGLVRFNKNTSNKLYYNSANSDILSDNILDILFYQNGLIISTDSGLCKFESGSFSPLSDTIQGLLLEDYENNLIVADCRAHLTNQIHFFKNNNLTKSIALFSGNFPQENRGITLAKDSSIWLVQNVFYNVDIYRIKGDTFEVHNNMNSPFRGPNPFGTNITSKGDSVFLALMEGIYLFDGEWDFKYQIWGYEDVPFVTDGKDTLDFRITALANEENNTFWCGSYSQGATTDPNLAYLQNNKWHILPKTGTPSSYISEIKPSEYSSRYVYVASTNGLLVIDKECLEKVSGIKEHTSLVSLHPNPSTGIYHLSGDFNAQNTQISVHSLSGRLLHSEKLNTNNTIDLSHLPQGVYFVELDIEGEKVKKKIVKE